jgi:hypothetical protein
MYWDILNTLATIFKHAFTKCFHNRAHNLSSSVKHPKTFSQMNALLTPKWSAWRDKLLTSCFSDISRCHIAIFDYVCTKWAAHSGEHPPHVL